MDMNSPSVVLAFSNFKIIGLSENNNNNVYSALLNIIMELKRALRILLETIVNYYKDTIIKITIVNKNVKCKLFHLLK